MHANQNKERNKRVKNGGVIPPFLAAAPAEQTSGTSLVLIVSLGFFCLKPPNSVM
jgi:hypothetical protein